MALYWGNKHRSQASGEDGVRGGAGSIDKYGEVSEHRAGDHSFPATWGRESFWSDVAPTPPSATRRSRALIAPCRRSGASRPRFFLALKIVVIAALAYAVKQEWDQHIISATERAAAAARSPFAMFGPAAMVEAGRVAPARRFARVIPYAGVVTRT